jgi:iron complex transport system substrate-binding protein
MQPSDAQTLWEIGAREKVVGMPVGQYTEYLEGHDKPEDVSEGDGITVSTEHVIDLEPDLVVASSVADEERVEQLRDAGLTVYQFEPETSIEDVIENTLTTGQLVGECEGANGTAEWMEGEIGAIEEAVEDEEAPLVLYAMGDGFTAGQGTFIEEIIETAGGENLGSSAGIEFYGQISEEVVIAEDPNWIVYPDNFEEPPVSEGVLEETTAGQEDRTVAVDAQRMNQPGPQVVYAIDALAEAFHPEAYAAMDEGEEAAETDEADDADETDDAADADETDETDDEEDDLPGFGIAAALVALLAAAFVLLRRR